MTKKKQSVNRTRQVIRAAKKIFAAKGFQESTISEIAKEAGLSEPTIYEYFASKEEILFAIPGETARWGSEEFETYLPRIKGAANKLRFMVHSMILNLENDPEYAAVSFLILKQSRKFTETDSYRTLRGAYGYMKKAIEDGVASGEFRPETDPFFIRAMILGTIEHLMIRKLLYNSDDDLLEYVDPIMDVVIRSTGNRPLTPAFQFKVTVEPEPKPQAANLGKPKKPIAPGAKKKGKWSSRV
jgi:AcrR family transcriptional regulator